MPAKALKASARLGPICSASSPKRVHAYRKPSDCHGQQAERPTAGFFGDRSDGERRLGGAEEAAADARADDERERKAVVRAESEWHDKSECSEQAHQVHDAAGSGLQPGEDERTDHHADPGAGQ